MYLYLYCIITCVMSLKYFYLIKFYSEHNTRGPTFVSVWHRLHCYGTGLIYVFIGLYILLYFTTLFLLVLYLAYIAHNAMPKKISTKCNVFLQLIISIILEVDRRSRVSASIFTSGRSHQYLWSNNCISRSSLCCYIARRTLFRL